MSRNNLVSPNLSDLLLIWPPGWFVFFLLPTLTPLCPSIHQAVRQWSATVSWKAPINKTFYSYQSSEYDVGCFIGWLWHIIHDVMILIGSFSSEVEPEQVWSQTLPSRWFLEEMMQPDGILHPFLLAAADNPSGYKAHTHTHSHTYRLHTHCLHTSRRNFGCSINLWDPAESMIPSLLFSANLYSLLIAFILIKKKKLIAFEELNIVAENSIKDLLCHPGILCCPSESVWFMWMAFPVLPGCSSACWRSFRLAVQAEALCYME